MLQLDLVPGEGLGPFKIGASLWSILTFVRQPQSKTLFPSVQVKYDSTSSAASIVLVHLHPYIDLLFSGRGQRLHTIALRRLRHGLPSSPKRTPQTLGMVSGSSVSSTRSSVGGSTLLLRYKGTAIASPEEVLRRANVMKVFGPTYEGDVMKYPGVSFIFEDDASGVAVRTARGTGVDENKWAEVKKVIISQINGNDEQVDAFDEVLQCPIMDGDLRSVIVKPHKGIEMHFFPESSPPTAVQLGLSSAEDIRAELGEPMLMYYKEDDRITIHAPTKSETTPSNDYFMNYFNHGIDFLMDGSSHILKKIILHSNTLGTPLFQRYKRCPWEIASPTHEAEPTVNYADTFEAVTAFLGKFSEASPTMELDRSGDYELLSIPASSTKLIGFDGIILEASASSWVASVTLY